MKTRKEYMNGDISDHEYYSQFVTDSTLAFVRNRIGVVRLFSSNCEHFNDIVRMRNNTWIWDSSPIDEKLANELGEGVSQSTRTRVGKAAAKIILEEHQDD